MTYMEDLINLKHINAIRNINENNLRPIIHNGKVINRDIKEPIEEVLKVVDKTLKNCLDLEFSVLVDYLLYVRNNNPLDNKVYFAITIPSEITIEVEEIEKYYNQTEKNIIINSNITGRVVLERQLDFSSLEMLLKKVAQTISDKKENKYISLYKHRLRMIAREVELNNLEKLDKDMHRLGTFAPMNPNTRTYVDGLNEDLIENNWDTLISMSTINYIVNNFYHSLGELDIPQKSRQETVNAKIVDYIKSKSFPDYKLEDVKVILDNLVCF